VMGEDEVVKGNWGN